MRISAWSSDVCSSDLIAFVGLGGNVGDAAATLREALAVLDGLPGTRVLRASPLYRTPAWGHVDQPDFVNAAAKLETDLDPRALLDALLDVERPFGRYRPDDDARRGPRTHDLALLLFGAAPLDRPGRTVPPPHSP